MQDFAILTNAIFTKPCSRDRITSLLNGLPMRQSLRLITLHGFFVAMLTMFLAVAASAQPEPSFEATCRELRAALDELEVKEGEWVTIAVAGTLRAVEHDGTLGYMLTCAQPDPQVLCVTYEVNDYKAGDRVVLAGTLNRVDDDHVSLDPCLHYPPDSKSWAVQ